MAKWLLGCWLALSACYENAREAAACTCRCFCRTCAHFSCLTFLETQGNLLGRWNKSAQTLQGKAPSSTVRSHTHVHAGRRTRAKAQAQVLCILSFHACREEIFVPRRVTCASWISGSLRLTPSDEKNGHNLPPFWLCGKCDSRSETDLVRCSPCLPSSSDQTELV